MNKKEGPQTLLAEAYVHFKPYEFKENEKLLLNQIREKAISFSKNYYDSDLLVTIEFEEGSIKSKVKFWGTLYLVIAGYGSFRTGLDYLVKDARNLGHEINHEVIQIMNPDRSNLFHAERRGGVPVRTKRIIKDLDYLSENIHDLSNNEIVDLIWSIKHRIILTLEYTNSIQDKRLILENISRETENNFPDERTDVDNVVVAFKRELEYLIEVRNDGEFEVVVNRLLLN